MSLLNLRQFWNLFLETFDWPTAQLQTIFKDHWNLCYLYHIEKYRVYHPEKRFILPHTPTGTCIIPYSFSLADQVTTDGAVTHENVPHHVVFTLFTADHVLHHSRKQIKYRFKSRQSEFFILTYITVNWFFFSRRYLAFQLHYKFECKWSHVCHVCHVCM